MNLITKSIPNFITALNILCGSFSILFAFEGNLLLASLFIGIASIFDFMDGMAARLLNAYSEIGKQLDSLADLISFGLAPSVILYNMMKLSTNSEFGNDFSLLNTYLILIPFLIVVFSALRLAKFNVDTRQTTSFIGLPTPANAILIASFPVIIYYSEIAFVKDILRNNVFLIILVVIQSFLLVSEIPMFSLKFSNLRFGKNKVRYIFLILSLALLIIFQTVAIPIIIFLYIIMSIVNNWITNK